MFNSYISIGKVTQAATVLGKSKEEDSLSLAAEMAKLVGQNIFADHVEAKKREVIKLKQEIEKNNEKPEEVESLPTRAELLLNDVPDQSDSDSFKDLEKDTKSDIISNLDVEESDAGPSGVKLDDNERNTNAKVEDKQDSSKTTNSAQLSGQIGNENAAEVVKDICNKTNEHENRTTLVNAVKEDNKVVVNVKKINEEQSVNAKEASDKDKTDELLEELPSKMKDLMTENSDQSGNVNGEANENVVSAKVKDASDVNENVNERGDHLTVKNADNN